MHACCVDSGDWAQQSTYTPQTLGLQICLETPLGDGHKDRVRDSSKTQRAGTAMTGALPKPTLLSSYHQHHVKLAAAATVDAHFT
jgi:hypothetical protein